MSCNCIAVPNTRTATSPDTAPTIVSRDRDEKHAVLCLISGRCNLKASPCIPFACWVPAWHHAGRCKRAPFLQIRSLRHTPSKMWAIQRELERSQTHAKKRLNTPSDKRPGLLTYFERQTTRYLLWLARLRLGVLISYTSAEATYSVHSINKFLHSHNETIN
jgi:hypothetical protein